MVPKAAASLSSNWLPPLGDPAWTFSKDTEGCFTEKEGRSVVEVMVPTGTKPNFQQARCVIENELLAGMAFRLTVDVRSRDVQGGVGAYAVIEFLDSDRKRLGLASSLMSLLNGAFGWTTLEAVGGVPKGCGALKVSLLLHANGVAWFANPRLVRTLSSVDWPDYGEKVRVLTPSRDPITQESIGVGFHCFQHEFDMTPEDFELVYRRWDDLNPSFARLNHRMKYGKSELDRMAQHLLRMQKTGTVFYITTWDPPIISNESDYLAYARRVADDLAYLIKEKGCTGIRWYCMTNELTLGKSGALRNDLPHFKEYHKSLFNEFQKSQLPVGLLATDSAPASSWPTIKWAAQNMPDITTAYGGHHYIEEYEVRSLDFAPWFEEHCRTYVAVAKAQHKPFLIGEFGSKQDGSVKDGVKLDRCVYYETPEEPWVGIQIAAGVIAALRGGAQAVGYWTFLDLPDFPFGPQYQNKWGLFRYSGSDRSFRSPYYAYGLLTRTFRGGLKVFPLENEDLRIRGVAGQSKEGKWVVAVVNRNEQPTQIQLALPKGIQWQVGRYQPEHVEPGVEGLLAPFQKLDVNGFEMAGNELAVLMQR